MPTASTTGPRSGSQAVRLSAFASEPHYRAHIEPVAAKLGASWEPGDGPVIVSSYKDYRAVAPRRVVYMEHGAGQTYGEGHNSYAGGKRRDRVDLFLCPSERVAEKNRAAHPDIRSVAVGCPKMDPFHRSDKLPEMGTVGIAFHWDALVCPESRSAFGTYRKALPTLAKRFETIGTAHPRVSRHVYPRYREAGIPAVSFEEICERASVFVCDNSSVAWEFLSLDRPVVWLNAPYYRRSAEHGMRFWEWADTGIQVDRPEDLLDAISASLTTDPQAERRREVIPQVYAARGDAADRAAAAIREFYGGTDG